MAQVDVANVVVASKLELDAINIWRKTAYNLNSAAMSTLFPRPRLLLLPLKTLVAQNGGHSAG